MSYDQWLEAPYLRRAAEDEQIEQIVEDLWNDETPLSEAIRLVSEMLPSGRPVDLNSKFEALIDEYAEWVFGSERDDSLRRFYP